MNIMMLGDSGVGKTSFMVCSYGLMRQGVENFFIDSTSSEQKNKFDRLFNNFVRKGVYPAATDKQSVYGFNFFNENECVMEFRWTDFKGGTINSDDDDDEVIALKKGIRRADAVLLFIEAEKLLNDADTQMEVMTLHYYLNQYASAASKRLTIMPLFTKFDLALEHTENFDDLWKRLTAPFSELQKTADQTDNIIFAPMPIACAPDFILHIDWVMLFLMKQGIILHYLTDSDAMVKQYEQAKAVWNEGSALADFFGISAKRDKARQIIKELQPKIELLSKMEKADTRLTEFFENYNMWESYRVNKKKYKDFWIL